MIGQLGPVFIASPFIATNGINVPEMGWMFMNGMVLLPLAFFVLLPRRATSVRRSRQCSICWRLFLAPVWVWFVFAEKPTENALLGGSILLSALVAHTVWEIRRKECKNR